MCSLHILLRLTLRPYVIGSGSQKCVFLHLNNRFNRC